MNGIGEYLIELRIATRNACNFEHGKGSFVTLRTKVLYLLSLRPAQPPELMERLCMVKSNLAILCNKMSADGVIEKERNSDDKRVISYHITDKGRAELAETVRLIEEKYKGVLTSEKDVEDAKEKIAAVLDLLSFI